MTLHILYTIFSYRLITLIVIECTLTEKQCYDQIYNQCPHKTTTFTTKQIQTTQLYLRKRFAATHPIRSACPISEDNSPCIRKDIKCLTEQEIESLTSAWVQLYDNGVIAEFSKIHYDYWGANHKFVDVTRWHYWLINLLEKELQKIDPSICMPYWNTVQDFASPEKSKIWEMFGHAGNESNDYCVPDGPFANIECSFPSEHCLRRQWSISPQLDPWNGPEYATMVQQMMYNSQLLTPLQSILISQTSLEMSLTVKNMLKYILIIDNKSLTPFGQRLLLQAKATHFDTHLSIGGWNGDMSVDYASNDPLFFIFHIYGELLDLLWQLSNFEDHYLVPKSYNAGVKYNNITATRRYPDIDSDTLNYYTNTYVSETFQFGFGDMCHLYDTIIEPINELINQNLQFEAKYPFTSLLYHCVPTIPPPIPSLPSTAKLPHRIRPLCNPPLLPTAAQRLKDSLSPSLFELYYPKFANNKWTFFDHLLPKISSDCNLVSNACKQLPHSLSFHSTPEGQRQYKAFDASVADFDITGATDIGEAFKQQFIDDLNNSGYCSLYV